MKLRWTLLLPEDEVNSMYRNMRMQRDANPLSEPVFQNMRETDNPHIPERDAQSLRINVKVASLIDKIASKDWPYPSN